MSLESVFVFGIFQVACFVRYDTLLIHPLWTTQSYRVARWDKKGTVREFLPPFLEEHSRRTHVGISPFFQLKIRKSAANVKNMSSDPLVAHAFSPRWMNPKIYLFLQFSSMSLLLLLAPDFRCLLFLYGQCRNCRPSVDHGMGFMRSWGPCYQGVVANNTLGWWSGCKRIPFPPFIFRISDQLITFSPSQPAGHLLNNGGHPSNQAPEIPVEMGTLWRVARTSNLYADGEPCSCEWNTWSLGGSVVFLICDYIIYVRTHILCMIHHNTTWYMECSVMQYDRLWYNMYSTIFIMKQCM